MTWQDIPFRECNKCEYIEDCPNPTVDQNGNPIPPNDCPKQEEIILTIRPREIINGNA
jgi:hypothetical protein